MAAGQIDSMCRLSLYVLLIILLPTQLPGQNADPTRVGFMASSFAGVDLKDAQVATDVWLGKFINKQGLLYQPKSIIFKDLDEALSAIELGEVEVINLSALDFLEIRGQTGLVPSLVGINENGSPYDRYVLLVHRDSRFKSIHSLKQKDIRIDARGRTPLVWLDTILLQERLPEAKEFFGNCTKVSNASQAVLPVFFKQSDVCLITEEAFNIMVELNTQIGEEMTLIARSPEFLTGLMIFAKDYNPADQEAVRQAVLRLHTEPEGMQVLTLLGVKKAITFESAHLGSVRNLIEEYNAVKPGEPHQ